MPKQLLELNVLQASKERISYVFDNFERICISFSGGKDSTVMLHLVMEEAIKRNKKVGVMFIDWECQLTLTIEHIQKMFDIYKDYIEPYWICLPIRTWNGCSQIETEWISWDEDKKDLWVREKPKIAIKDKDYFPFYFDNMMFEEFTPLFIQWFGQGKLTASFIGIRSQESLNRYRTIAREKPMFNNKPWTTNVIDNCWNIYPQYDWKVEDDWTYFGKFNKNYNKLYDRMYQAGMTINQMRIDEPFGDTQRQGLWLYQIVEPQLWAKMCIRVAGANTGALYCQENGNILGNDKLKLPKGHTWKSFTNFILDTMPPKTSEHYKNKIAVYLRWYEKRGYPKGIPDFAEHKLETYGKVPSWRRICKSLLRNDYWCRGIGFSPTKSQAYVKYLNMMKKRRNNWQIYPLLEKKEKEIKC